jgi:hypothetical protein
MIIIYNTLSLRIPHLVKRQSTTSFTASCKFPHTQPGKYFPVDPARALERLGDADAHTRDFFFMDIKGSGNCGVKAFP